MTSIMRYRIVSDALTTYRLREQDSPDMDATRCTELCTLEDGYTYVAVPDGVTLPDDQPASVAATLEPVSLDDVLRDQIKAASPHTQLIAQRVLERIRERYSVDDELFFARITIGQQMALYDMPADELAEVAAFKDWVEQARAWGRAQRAALGLG